MTNRTTLNTEASAAEIVHMLNLFGCPDLAEAFSEMRDELARARAITGPPCPVCHRFLKAEHCVNREGDDGEGDLAYFRTRWTAGEAITRGACITASDLLTNHPAIAEQMGLTKDVF